MTGEGTSDAGIAVCTKKDDIPEAARKVAEAEAKRIAKEKEEKRNAEQRRLQRLAAGTKTKQARLTESFSGEFANKADAALVKLMAAHGLPFVLAESPLLQDFIDASAQANTIRPYKPCNRKKAAGPVLDAVHDELEKELLAPLLEQQHVYGSTIMSDGLTDKRKHPLLNFVLAIPGHEYVVAIEDASGHSKTKQYITDLLAPIVEGNTNVDLVTMDGANAEALTLCETRWPWISGVKCLTHSLSLIFSDLAKVKFVLMQQCELPQWLANISSHSPCKSFALCFCMMIEGSLLNFRVCYCPYVAGAVVRRPLQEGQEAGCVLACAPCYNTPSARAGPQDVHLTCRDALCWCVDHASAAAGHEAEAAPCRWLSCLRRVPPEAEARQACERGRPYQGRHHEGGLLGHASLFCGHHHACVQDAAPV
jgi:hypothetical protein